MDGALRGRGVSDVSVRILDPSTELSRLRDIRLESLRENPEAFSADLEMEEAMTPQDWVARSKRGITFGGFRGDSLEGIVVFSQPQSRKTAHTGEVGAMYVRQAARGTGLADAMMTALIAHAGGKVEQLRLGVNAENPRAVKFYERHGFRAVGRVPRYIRIGGRVFDELIMVRPVSTSD